MLVQVALFIFAMSAMLSLVIDIGYAHLTQGQMQSAADSAAIEGIRQRDAVANAAAADAARREAVNTVVGWTFDDNFDPTDGDADYQFGAGPIIDLTEGDFDIAVRYGSGRYPGLHVEPLMKNEVFPACSPRLLEAGPPLRTPDDLRRHALIHDQAVDRDPVAPSWPMWLKAAGVTGFSGTSGVTYNASYLALDAAIAGHGIVLATSTIAAADIAAGRLVRLFSLALPDLFAYYIVTAPGALERAKVKAFRDWLRQEADG